MLRSSLLVAGLALSALGAQSPDVSAEEFGSTAIGSGYGLWREAGTLCGGGPSYRAEFRGDGMSFIPALPDAPRTFSLRLTLEDLRRGAVAVQLLDAGPTRHDSSVVYARGPGVTERYDLGADGVEQSFVLESPPLGQGDLVVRLRVHTELRPERLGDVSAGMRWLSPDWGGVEIGRAIAHDANGRSFAMAMRCDGSHLELTLPAASADAARYPLLLDPPIGTSGSLSGASGDINPDIAYDARTNSYLAVWNRRLSLTRSEVRAQLLAADGRLLGSLIPVETGAVVARNPVVANVAASDRFMVVWQQAAGPFGPWNVYGRAVETSGAQSARIQITGAASSDIDPDLGGSSNPASRTIPLVWHRVGEGIRGVHILVPSIGNPQQGPSAVVIGNGDVHRPRISQSGGSPGVYAVAWENAPTSGATRVEVAMVTNAAARLAGPTIVSNTGFTSERPAVDGDGTDFMIVYERTVSSSDRDVYCRMLRYDGRSLTVRTSARRIGASLGDQMTPDVGWLGPKYLVAWADNANRGGFLDHDLHLLSLSPDCEVCGQEYVVRRLSTAYDHDPAIATQRSTGSSGTEAMVTFSAIDSGLVRTSVRTQRFDAFGTGGSSSAVGSGCGNGGTMHFDGPLAFGNVDLRVELRGADLGATAAALFLGLGGRSFPCGSCVIVDPAIALPVAVNNGTANSPLPLSCSLLRSGPGISADLQWLTLGGTGSDCPIAASLATSNRIRIMPGF